MVRDTASGRIGVVMDHLGTYVQLRPPGGGREWDTRPEDLRPAETGDVLLGRVQELNENRRRWRR